MHARFIVIGGGLSGLAAAIRLARFHGDVLLLEKHTRVGGLNSYYYRNNRLFETGLHAITNFAEKADRHAPLNKLLRQLKIRRSDIGLTPQRGSEIHFPGCNLRFTNELEAIAEEIGDAFKADRDGFSSLVRFLDSLDPFTPKPYRASRPILHKFLKDHLLIDMLLCPICYYGSSWEGDIDFNQFAILFRSIFQEGLFRPHGTIKDLLDLLVRQYEAFGGKLRLRCGVEKIIHEDERAVGVVLDTGDEVSCDYLVSTIGIDETRELLGAPEKAAATPRLCFIESIFQLDESTTSPLPRDTTCIFYSTEPRFAFRQPQEPVDFTSGAITLPDNFGTVSNPEAPREVRTTHLANYSRWNTAASHRPDYEELKVSSARTSRQQAETIIGAFAADVVYHDSFTPLTVERYTSKRGGAIYGSPEKRRDGTCGYANLIIAGTDQGFLGIVGSMMSGVSMVNQHIMTKV